MKSSFQIGILCTVFCLGSTFFSSAVQTVNIGSTFSCTFLDSGEKGFFDSSSTHTWTSDQIDSAIRALNTWNTLINSTPGRTLNVGLTWYDGADSSTLASAYSPYYYYLSNKPQQVSTMAEAVWRDGSTRTTSGYDIYIQCNTSHLASLYYGAALLDSLLTNQEGQSIVEKAGNGNTAFTLGETLSLGDTGLTVYNPTTWSEGSSMAHIDSTSDPDALMQYSISPDTYHRTLTDGEVGLMRSMGWNMVPEPATATLSLLGLAALALRRRRC